MVERMRVAIVDLHPLFREGVKRALVSAGDFDVVGEAGSLDAALAVVKSGKPDAVLVDIDMRGCGLEIVRLLRQAAPGAKLIVLTAVEEDQQVRGALRAGAHGYVLKRINAEELFRTLRSIHLGEAYVTPELAARLLTVPSGASTSSVEGPLTQLTHRERQILELVSMGKTNKEIARELSLSDRTIKHYMTGVLQKLNVRNRLEAVILLRRRTVNAPAIEQGMGQQQRLPVHA